MNKNVRLARGYHFVDNKDKNRSVREMNGERGANYIGTRIKELLVERGLVQHRIERKSGCSENYLSLIITGRRTPKGETLRRILDAIGISWDEFWEGNNATKGVPIVGYIDAEDSMVSFEPVDKLAPLPPGYTAEKVESDLCRSYLVKGNGEYLREGNIVYARPTFSMHLKRGDFIICENEQNVKVLCKVDNMKKDLIILRRFDRSGSWTKSKTELTAVDKVFSFVVE